MVTAAPVDVPQEWREALTQAGESEGALALGASEVLRMGLELAGSLVRLRDLQEQVAALRQGCEVSHGG